MIRSAAALLADPMPNAGPRIVSSSTASPDYLADVGAAFLDASAMLEAARACGLPQAAEIVTTAPALLLDGRARTTRALTKDARARLMQTLHDVSLGLFEALSADPRLARFSLTAARRGVSFATHYLAKAATLVDDDFARPRAVVVARTGTDRLDTIFNAPWPEILADNANLRILEVSTPLVHVPQEHPGRLARLRIAPLDRAYRLALCLAALPWLGWRGPQVYIATETDLLRETAVSLAVRGARLHRLPAAPATSGTLAAADADALRSSAERVVAPFVAAWTPARGRARLMSIFLRDVVADCDEQDGSERFWRQDLAARPRPAAILSNYPKGRGGMGMLRAARSLGVRFVAFQHGVGRELGRNHYVGQAWYENACADDTVVFNDTAARVSDASPFRAGAALVAGAAAASARFGRYRRPRRGAAPILYASTNLYAGNSQMPSGLLSDAGRAELELRLVTDVLARLPHRVLFKTYPEQRYLDPDPVHVAARAAANIEVFERRQDLRYLMADCRVIVTSRATSTVGVCLAGERPLVFIDDPEDQPLAPAVLAEFAQAVFLFNAGEKDMLDRLRAFLSQDLREIDRAWSAKAAVRKSVIEHYIAKTARGAGASAATQILARVAASAGGSHAAR